MGTNVWLVERQHQRVEEWSVFMNEMCSKSAAVDEKFDDELQKVANYYKEMENKFHIIDDMPK
ncbi:hypothetical protein LSH36_332g01057 [Paralvinella palmiformis]|uniref:Biogenesis of lysosome-related organelles complex 1 subunit 5 n=1 Tax=Paralvinella palmiformis TaxID=53620 RepID=A0AAD9JFM9_9ANNE|nr:hypothetical protein LSH36_332g01057 [Paralvinella palmiformis]